MRYLLAVWLGRFIIFATRLAGNAGSALPGLIIEKIYPSFIARATKQLSDGVVLITGTNGKTTTNKLLAGIAAAAGRGIIVNRAGGNLSRGIASVMLDHMNLQGKIDADIGLFEVDEAFLPDVAKKTQPKTIVVLNLLRDQLDRYGELDRTAQLISQGLEYAQEVTLNADDPLVAALANNIEGADVSYFGSVTSIRDQLPHDAALFTRKLESQKGEKSASLSLKLLKASSSRGEQRLAILQGGKNYHTTIKLPGLYNAVNAVAALTAATQIGIDLATALAGIKDVKPAFGRTELIKLEDKSIQLLLVKNPAGFNQVITNFLLKAKSSPILIAINDNFADGRDVSWLWDINFESLSKTKRNITTGGIRGYDMALRLKYAGIKATPRVEALGTTLNAFLDTIPKGGVGYIVPTYTAMLNLRKLLKKRAKLEKVWQ